MIPVMRLVPKNRTFCLQWR